MSFLKERWLAKKQLSAGPSLWPVPTATDRLAASSTPFYALTVVGQSASAVGPATTAEVELAADHSAWSLSQSRR
ncbi:MAG TPA: hypothetical protein VFI95_22315 [Terriglobales bacterium]|nr:hypothetical protein [Terriglobales bacterium]